MSTEKTAIAWEQAEGIVTLTLDDPDASSNTMNDLYRRSMATVIARLEAEKAAMRGVVVTSAKKTFFAGGNLNELKQAQPEHAQGMWQTVREMTSQLRKLETLGVPVVAAINGAALGGGLEIALACHYRIVLDDKKIELGLPEVTLGLMPGGNGVVRTVRLLGLQKALMEVLLPGTRMRPDQAKNVGIIDELVSTREELVSRAHEWIAANPGAKQVWDRDGYKMPGGVPSSPQLAMQLPAFPANLRKQLKGANMPGPKLILAAAVEGAQTDFANAAKIETRYFVELATGRVAKNLIQAFFFDLQKINQGESRPKQVAPWKPSKVGILGGGMMGSGIAYVTAKAGIPCVIKDVSQERAEHGKDYSRKLIEKAVARGSTTAEAGQALLGLIGTTGDAADLAGCDMVIEAVFEKRELKATVTREAEAHTAPNALICSNTSTLPITGLATAAKDARRFIGLHFFSPVDKMPLVEIIRGKETGDEALAQAFDFVQRIKKTPIVVNDSRGFYTSRVFGTFVNEGVTMLAEGWSPASIEQAALQNGSPVGPLAVNDEVSLELARAVRLQTARDLEAEGRTFEPTPTDKVVERMVVEFGRKGKAAGAGFYEYPGDGKKFLWPGLTQHFVRPERSVPSPAEFQALQDRLLYITSIESIRCLEENVVRSTAEANIGSIMGIGAPPWTGGTLQFVNYVGTREFAARARQLAETYGPRFAPPKLLLEKAEKNEPFE